MYVCITYIYIYIEWGSTMHKIDYIYSLYIEIGPRTIRDSTSRSGNISQYQCWRRSFLRQKWTMKQLEARIFQHNCEYTSANRYLISILYLQYIYSISTWYLYYILHMHIRIHTGWCPPMVMKLVYKAHENYS